jgi:hypothetical protein
VWHRATWTPQDVQEIAVDDVFDVIRRRRYDRFFVREERSLLS